MTVIHRNKAVKGPKSGPAQWLAKPERQKLAAWLSLPRSERVPAKHQELAAELPYQPETLSHWARHPYMVMEVVSRVRANNADRLPKIIDAIAARAETGDPSSAMLHLSFAFNWLEPARANLNQEIPTTGRGAFDEPEEGDAHLPSWMEQG